MSHVITNSVRLGRLLWGRKKCLSAAMALAFVAVSVRPFMVPIMTGLLINRLVVDRTFDSGLAGLVGLFVLSQAVPAIFWVWQTYLVKSLWLFLSEHFELALVIKKGELDVAVIEDPALNDLINKVNENGCNRIQMFTERQFWFLQNFTEVCLASGVLIVFNWWAFGLIFLATVPQLVVELKYGKETWDIHDWHAEKRRRYWNLNRHLSHAPWLIELKVFQSVGYFYRMIRSLLLDFRNEQRRLEARKALASLAAVGLSKVVFALAAVWFVWEVTRGNLQVGSLVLVLASINEMRNSLSGCFFNMGRQYEDSLFVKDVFDFLDLRPVVQKPANGVKLPAGMTPEIVFENVYFAYPKTGKMVLNNFNLRIRPGAKVALVGINGVGKTTLIKLLCRFYDPTQGRILIDGYDLRAIDLDSWYAHLGVLFQEYADYKFTVNEAVAVGDTRSGVDYARVATAACQADASAFIGRWNDGYKQQLGKEFTGGVEPSRGQWQKLALARAWYRSPNVLVLDEPTSSVDAEAEAKIFSRLAKVPSDKTVIFISHRFSTVRQAEQICVVEDGRVTGVGPHQVLRATNRSYARLFELQAAGYQ